MKLCRYRLYNMKRDTCVCVYIYMYKIHLLMAKNIYIYIYIDNNKKFIHDQLILKKK